MKLPFSLSLAACLFVCFNLNAQENSSESSSFFMKLYSSICVNQGSKPNGAKEFLEGRNMPKLTSEQAEPFLKGKSGTVWPAFVSAGNFAVVTHDSGLCSVVVQKANAKEIDSSFKAFVEAIPYVAPYKMVKTADELNGSGKSATHYQSYQFGVPGGPGSFHFALTTTESDEANPQALATFGRVSENVP